MPSRGLIVLAVVTVFCVVACWVIVGQRYSDVPSAAQEGGPVFPAFATQLADVEKIVVHRASGEFTLSQNGDMWANGGIGGFTADTGRIKKMLTGVASLRYLEAKTLRSALHKKLGVEDIAPDAKSTRLTLLGKNNTVLADLLVGKTKERSATNAQSVYIRLVGEKRVWLAEGSLDVHYDAIDWSNNHLIDLPAKDLSSVSIEHADGQIVSLYRDTARKMTLGNIAADTRIAHQYQIDFMAGLLEGVSFIDAKPLSTSDSRAASAFFVTVSSLDHFGIEIQTAAPEQDGSIWVTLKAWASSDPQASEEATQEAERINADFGGWSVKLPRKFTDRLKIRLSDIIETPIKNNEQIQ